MDVPSRKGKRGRQSACLVAIVGGSGSGKSYLTQKLAELLGENVRRLTLDDFYRDRSHCSPATRARINFDHPRAIDWKTFESVLEKLAVAKPALVPRYDFATHTRRPSSQLVAPGKCILVEGLWLLHRPSLRRLFDLSIYLECSSALRLRRRLARDTVERGRTAASVKTQYEATVAPMHDQFVTPQARWADIVVRRSLSREGIARLAKQIRESDSEPPGI